MKRKSTAGSQAKVYSTRSFPASIPGLLAKPTASGYDEGVALLAELRDLAVHQGLQAAFDARLAEVTAPSIGSVALQRRLKEKRPG